MAALLGGCSEAEQPAIPDISQLTSVNSQTFLDAYPRFQWLRFRTANGFWCEHDLDDAATGRVTCRGPRPDKGPGDWLVSVDANNAATISPAPAADTEPERDAVLEPQHMVQTTLLMCGAYSDGTLACRTSAHGFVLRPDSTTLF